MLVNLTPHPIAIYRNRTAEDGPAEVEVLAMVLEGCGHG